MDLFQRWQASLAELRARGRWRRLSAGCGVDFCSNDYLGFGAELAESRPSLPHSGLASRLLRGQHALWNDVESILARWHGTEAALVFTSGYVANEGLLATIVEPEDFLASDQRNHASIIDGARLGRGERFVFRHNDLNHLQDGLKTAARKRSQGRQLFVVTESLFGMDGDRSPLRDLAELCERHHAHLIVDEAHATGCFGPHGSGLVDEAGLRPRMLATVHTGGKALGVMGAYVCGSARLREILINRCRQFIFTTALPPAVAAWWLDMLPRVQAADDRRQQLHRAANYFRAALKERGLAATGNDYILPVPLGDDARAMRAAERLQQLGYDIRAIRPPSVPPGTARLRISIHADHTSALLDQVAGRVAEVVQGET